MNLLKLYKIHINSNPDGIEIHKFFNTFDLGLEIKHPNEKLEKIRKEKLAFRIQKAEEYIFNNSKLINNKFEK